MRRVLDHPRARWLRFMARIQVMLAKRQLHHLAWEAAGGRSRDALYRRACRHWAPLDATTPCQTLDDYLARGSSVDLNVEYLFVHDEPSILEGRQGYAIADPGTLLELSTARGWYVRSAAGRIWVGLPSPWPYRTARRRRDQIQRHPGPVAVLGAQWSWTTNYYHFFGDLMSRLAVMDKVGIAPDLPIVVQESLARMPWFRQAAQSPALMDRTFLPLGLDDYLAVDSVTFASPSHPAWSRDVLERLSKMTAGESDCPRGDLRVFIHRPEGAARAILNFAELRPILEKHRFLIVDMGTLSLKQQADLIRQTRCLAGVHGAGLVNMLHGYCHDMRILEIHAPAGDNPEFRRIAQALGFSFTRLRGCSDEGGVTNFESFRVDPSQFAAAVEALVDGR